MHFECKIVNANKKGYIKMAIMFYKVDDRYGCFSNFSKHGFELNGKYWLTSEHYFQARKFVRSDIEEEVRLASTPMEAARIGRDRNKPLRKDWEDVKNDIMKKAVLEKFRTHKEIQDLLIATGDEELIEETTDDYYWGCGADGTGKNVLGKILMDVRSILKASS